MNHALANIPFFDAVQDSRRILIAGAGGGCDIYCGLPIYLALQGGDREVHLANLSFSNLHSAIGESPTPALVTVDADTDGSTQYFPERRLCEWFRDQGKEIEVNCFHRTGVKPLRAAYQYLVDAHKIDTIILVDAGTDSLARGDEYGLGTPQEDMASLAAVSQVDVPHKLLLCLGFGVDAYHGICHAQFLESVAALAASGGFLGAFSLLPSMAEAVQYREAVSHLSEHLRGYESIVNTSIQAAVEGKYGDYHSSDRTRGGKLWINPLMSLYWAFDASSVADRSLYLDQVLETHTYQELSMAIEKFRHHCDRKSWDSIPV